MKKFNYQSAKFNDGLRERRGAFGKLSLNFAICTLLFCGDAVAAKLCMRNPPNGGKFTRNPTANIWANGPDCMTWSTGENSVSAETDPMKLCPNVKMHGESRFIWFYNAAGENRPVAGESASTEPEKGSCLCKINYPFQTKWFLVGPDYNSSNTCNRWCGSLSVRPSDRNFIKYIGLGFD
ncbi:MAG: hypothetical protein LBL46_02420 [Rickettsiales bacterium]|nr:hypothetical protein [Rickettsiales bacterium]